MKNRNAYRHRLPFAPLAAAAVAAFAATAWGPTAVAQAPQQPQAPVLQTGQPPIPPDDPLLGGGPPPVTPDTRTPDVDQLPPDTRDEATRIKERGGARGKPTTAAGWKDYAEGYLAREEYAKASEGFREASKIYAGKGDFGASKVLAVRAERYETQAKMFLSRPARKESVARHYTGKRLEPMYGAYIGAFIDREDGVQTYFTGVNGQIHKDVDEFNKRIGKRHATYFMYTRYGNPFPYAWFQHLKENGAAAQWVMQPQNMNDVQDNEYLTDLAKEAARIGIPIFVRFAGEMNGDWVPYHGDPELYKEKFRLVSRVFHQWAPNVAMVWCPNEVPENKIPSYYPGADAVDWVGVNFYSVYYNDNDSSKPVNWRNPADQLDYVYRNYADKHPILIGECAATHQASADNVIRADYASDKIAQLYSALPRRYPRIKAIHWFDMNAIKWAAPSRRINNYALLEEPKVRDAYLNAVSDPYYLSKVDGNGAALAPFETTALTPGDAVAGKVRLSALVKTYEERPTVNFIVGGKTMKTFNTPGRYDWVLDTKQLPNGPTEVILEVRDSKGRIAGSQSVPLKVDNGNTELAAALTRAAEGGVAPTVVATTPVKPVAAVTPPPVGGKTRPTGLVEGDADKPATLGSLMEGALVDPSKLILSTVPSVGRLNVGEALRFAVVPNTPGYLFLLQVSPSASAAGEAGEGDVALLFPRGGSDPTAIAAAAKVTPGDMVSVPKDANRVLRPRDPGKFIIRAVLLPNADAAQKFAAALAASNTAGELSAKLKDTKAAVPASAAAYKAERQIEVVQP